MKLYKCITSNCPIRVEQGSYILIEGPVMKIFNKKLSKWDVFDLDLNLSLFPEWFLEVEMPTKGHWVVGDTIVCPDPGDESTYKHRQSKIPCTIENILGIFINTKTKEKNIEWKYEVSDPYEKSHKWFVFESEITGGSCRYWFIRANGKIACTFIGNSKEADALHFHTGNMFNTYEDALERQKVMYKTKDAITLEMFNERMRKNKKENVKKA